MEYYYMYQVPSSNHSQNIKLKSEINNTNFTSFKTSTIQNEHSFEGIFSQSHIFTLIVRVKRGVKYLWVGLEKFFHLKCSNSSESITSSLLVSQQLSSSRRGGVGQKSLLFFFPIIINFKWCYFFLLFILNLVNRLYYMEIKSNNSNYRLISTKLIIFGRAVHRSGGSGFCQTRNRPI